MKATASEFYEKEARTYDDKRFSTFSGRMGDSLQKKAIKDLCSFSRGDIIIDVGTGTGRFALEIAKQGTRTIGVDSASAMIQQARSKAVERGFHQWISLAIADGHALPFRAHCAHWCISVNVLLHIQDYEAVLKQMAQVLRKGGHLVTNFPILQSAYFPIALIVNLRKRAMFERVYSRWFTLGEVRRSLFRAGFQIENTIGLLLVTKQTTSRLVDVWLAHFMSKMRTILACSVLRYLSGMLFIKSRKP